MADKSDFLTNLLHAHNQDPGSVDSILQQLHESGLFSDRLNDAIDGSPLAGDGSLTNNPGAVAHGGFTGGVAHDPSGQDASSLVYQLMQQYAKKKGMQ